MLRYAEKKNKILKPAAPICLPFLLDGLGSREVFLLKRHGSIGLSDWLLGKSQLTKTSKCSAITGPFAE